jgi:outer membrane protein assembly factor BamB
VVYCHFMYRHIALLVFLAVAGSAWAQESWPGLFGPSQNDHAVATTLPTKWSESEHVKWKTPIRGTGWSSPVIFGDQIWMTTALNEGHSLRAVCVDKTSGRIIHDIEVLAPEDPGHTNDFNSYASPTPVIEPGRVYVCFGTNGSACIDAASGKILWKNLELKIDHMEGAGSSPILYKDLYILNCDGTDDQYVAALDKLTGKIAWKSRRLTPFFLTIKPMRKAFTTPIIVNVDGKDQLISVGAFRCAAYDPANGKELWFCPIAGFSNAPRPVYADGLLFVCTGDSRNQLWAIRCGGSGDVSKTHIVWKYTDICTRIPTPTVVDDLLYMPMDTGQVRCLEAKTGKMIWTERLSTQFVASPLYANGLLYLCSIKGQTFVLRPGRKLEVLAKNQLDGKLMASPAVSGNALFLRTSTHLYRIE